MNPQLLSSMRLTACAWAALALVACGGDNGGSDTQTAQSASVEMTTTAQKVTVSAKSGGASAAATAASGAASQPGGGGHGGSSQWTAVQLAFTATPTAGADPGLTGTLMLRTEVENGATELEGRILPSATVNGANVDPAALTALVAEIKARVDPLRTAFVAAVDALKQKLKADLAAATTDAERKAAKDTFSTAFKAAHDKLQADIAAVLAEFRDRLAALGVTDPASVLRGGGEHGGKGGGNKGIEIEGTAAADGAFTATAKAGKAGKIQLKGTMAADGSLSGTYTGPGATDAGTFSAKPTTTPAP